VDARLGRVLDGFPGAVDVIVVAAGQAADHGAFYFARDRLDRLEIARGGDGEASLDHVDAEVFERVGDFQLFGEVHAGAGRLLAVAERGVENDEAVRGHGTDSR